VLTGDEPGLGHLFAAEGAEVVLLALSEDRARALCAQAPELEGRVLRVGEASPRTGATWLRAPFDAHALTAFVRRGEAREG
jgi:hypothetical protein